LLLLRAQQVHVEEKERNYYLIATTQGRTIDRDRHQLVDVKAVTLHRFQLENRRRLDCNGDSGYLLHIDGSYGEGGGQILRTSLSLAAITGQLALIASAPNAKTWTSNQHLTGVRAAAAVCQATVKGDTLGSTTLEFIPNRPTQAGKYTFDVAQTVGTGSAGRLRSFCRLSCYPH